MPPFMWLAMFSARMSSNSLQENYCASDLCSFGETHIACRNNGSFAAICPNNSRLITITPDLINSIVTSHNNKRQQLASGNLTGFPTARRMAVMRWDPELAALAELNVKQCRMRHDECHNTKIHRLSGQNLGYYGYSGDENRSTDDQLITLIINSWWNEYTNFNISLLSSYPNNYNGPVIGHFTVMARESNWAIGCAASRYFLNGLFNFLFACNYATTNIIDFPIYNPGTPTSGCSTGPNNTYKALCSSAEVYRI